jgi:divalent metal cation (Fe/Co/Zn/Cd) transporter
MELTMSLHLPSRSTHRIESLLYFVQSIFLLFACVYIAKESLEHVLLDGHHHGGDHEEEFE